MLTSESKAKKVLVEANITLEDWLDDDGRYVSDKILEAQKAKNEEDHLYWQEVENAAITLSVGLKLGTTSWK